MSPLSVGAILFEPTPAENFPLIATAVVGAMYFLGGRRFRRACRAGTIAPARIRTERLRTTWFVLGLVLLVFSLQEPIDKWADQLFWVHMIQHMMLIVVVAPLVVLGAPWMRVFRALPLRWRRALSLWVLKGRTGAPVRAIARWVGRPWVCWTLLALDVVVWHIPGAYDLTLRSEAVHYSEHATFLVFGIFVWGHLIESPPFHCVLSEPLRIVYAFSQMVVMWVLGLLLALAEQPWYSAYANLSHRPGGISALTDQQLAGGIMWVPASLPFSVAIIVWIYRWVSETFITEPPIEEPARLPPSPGLPPAPFPLPASPTTFPLPASPAEAAVSSSSSMTVGANVSACLGNRSNASFRVQPGAAPDLRRHHG
jgi:cytochrome c oxidase assembly factor CtaG